MRARRPGFTLVEVLAAMTVASLLAAIAVPQFQGWVTRARAAEVAGELRVIQHAAYTYFEQNGEWPEDAAAGEVPGGMESMLPAGFEFRTPRHTWDWDQFELPQGPLVGVAVTAIEPKLDWALASMFEGSAIRMGERHMFFIESPIPLPIGEEVGSGSEGGGDPVDQQPEDEHPGRGPDGSGPPGQDNKGRGNNAGQGNEDPGSRGEDQRNERGNGGRSGR